MCKILMSLSLILGLFSVAFLGGCSNSGTIQERNPGVYGYQTQEPTNGFQQQQQEWDRSHNPYESEMEEDE